MQVSFHQPFSWVSPLLFPIFDWQSFKILSPSSEMPIQIELENLYEAQSLASVPSPFVMSFITWLSAMVGSVLLFLATNQMTLILTEPMSELLFQ